MSRVVFYGITEGWGTLTRIAAIARWIPDSLVVVAKGGAHNEPLDYFGVSWIAAECEKGCKGLPPSVVLRQIELLSPSVLVMDTWPHGRFHGEVQPLVKSRNPKLNAFINLGQEQHSLDEFNIVFEAEVGARGIDVTPLVPFDESDILTREAARDHVGAGELPVVLVPHSRHTSPDLLEYVRRQCTRLGYHLVEWHSYPLMPYMLAADVIVGFAGWGLHTEAEAVKVPLLSVASNDGPSSQQWRANCRTGEDLLRGLENLEIRDDQPAEFLSGGRRAAMTIREKCHA